MRGRILLGLLCVAGVVGVAYVAGGRGDQKPDPEGWTEVAPGVLRSPGMPYGYALVGDGKAPLIDAPCAPEGLKAYKVEKIDGVLLTHHHRDTAAFVAQHGKAGVPVRAPKKSADWLTPQGVEKYWKE